MPQRELFDVAIIGGGSAGTAAALGAASSGARTLLVERCATLGGNVSQALVHTICGLFHAAEAGDPEAPADGPVPAHPGWCGALPAELLRRGVARPPERAGKVWVLPICPSAFEQYLADRVASTAGLECWTQSELFRAQLASQGDDSNLLELRRDGRAQSIEANIVIDASGDGVLAQLGAADGERAAPAQLQRPSFIFRLSGVEATSLEGVARLRLTAEIAGAERSGALPPGCESALVRPGAAADEAYVTVNLPPLDDEAFEPQDDDYRQRMEERGRDFAQSITALLRDRHAPFAGARIAAFPHRLGVREGHRLTGQSIVEESDILRGRRRDDEVALSTWPVELWQDHRRARMRYPAGPCSIPLGALVSCSHPRLGMAGRCLSASHEALGALRVIGTALATGDAVGRAAAIAADSDRSLWQVKAEEVRDSIRATQVQEPAP